MWRLTHVERRWEWASSRAACAERKFSGKEEGGLEAYESRKYGVPLCRLLQSTTVSDSSYLILV